MTRQPPSRSTHCLMDRHHLCRDGARIRCVCPCGHEAAPLVTEPDIPMTFVACADCGSLTDIHATSCPGCNL